MKRDKPALGRERLYAALYKATQELNQALKHVPLMIAEGFEEKAMTDVGKAQGLAELLQNITRAIEVKDTQERIGHD